MPISSDQYAQMVLRLRNENKAPVEVRPIVAKPTQVPSLDSSPSREDQSLGRPRVSLTLCRTRLLDPDNAWGSVKSLVDGLQQAGLIRGDSETEITLEVKQEKVTKRSDEGTIIEIDYVD